MFVSKPHKTESINKQRGEAEEKERRSREQKDIFLRCLGSRRSQKFLLGYRTFAFDFSLETFRCARLLKLFVVLVDAVFVAFRIFFLGAFIAVYSGSRREAEKFDLLVFFL